MPRKKRIPMDIAQTSDVWYCAIRKLKGWTQERNEDFFRPFIFVVIHMNSNLILAMDVLVGNPSAQEVADKLSQTILKPTISAQIPAHRPAEIHMEDRDLALALAPILAEIQIGVSFQPQPEPLDDLVANFEEQLFADQEDIPGLLQQPEVTIEQCEQLFAAAADFFESQPWRRLTNYDLLLVRAEPVKTPLYVIVMGQGGAEFGLSVYRDLHEVRQFFTAEGPENILAEDGLQVLMFNSPPDISIADMDAAEQNGWRLPGPDYFPTPVIYLEHAIQRPGSDMLGWYEGALRAIPEFVNSHLPMDMDGISDPIQADIQVSTSQGNIVVHIEYPAADLSPYDQSLEGDWEVDYLLEDGDWNDGEDDGQDDLRLGLGSAERALVELITAVEAGDEADPALQQAQELIYDAWEAADPQRRIDLAHQALHMSADCADAYVLLANDEARTKQQALEYFQAGVAAGKRALGEAFLRDPETVGHFWGILKTRPYMRALEGEATLQWLLGQQESAEGNYREMLRLNPNDNQGIRYLLLQLLMEQDRFEDSGILIEQYKEDASTDWSYTHALLLFRQLGDGRKANRALNKALKFNPYVPAYLTGRKRLIPPTRSFVAIGGEQEAVQYAANYQRQWKNIPGALDWLSAKMT
jgi:hypothetical protein